MTSDRVYQLYHFTSHPMTWVGGGWCVHVVGGQWGNFWEQNVLYLFWPKAKHLKAFFMVRSALRVQYPYSNAIVQQSFSLLRLSSAVSGPQCESSGLLSASFCLVPQRGSCWWLILETRSTGLSALRTRWRVTGPGWLGLKCVKTGSLLTVFGNTSKKWNVFGFVVFFVFFYFDSYCFS